MPHPRPADAGVLSGLELQGRLAEMEMYDSDHFRNRPNDQVVRTRALRRGAVAFLSKPFSDEALFDAMRLALT